MCATPIASTSQPTIWASRCRIRSGRAPVSSPSVAGRLLTVPAVKYHLPRLDEPFRDDEYAYTTRALAEGWRESPLLLEKDFSPTLAGDPLADEKRQILRWLREVPGRIKAHANVRLAMKLMNARFEDDFQREMMDAASAADALVVFNRLFDSKAGVAYGGPELS